MSKGSYQFISRNPTTFYCDTVRRFYRHNEHQILVLMKVTDQMTVIIVLPSRALTFLCAGGLVGQMLKMCHVMLRLAK